MKNKTDWYKVKKIVWNVEKSGKLRPILQLTKSFELNDEKFDGLLTDIDTVENFQIGKGSILKVEIQQGTIYDIKQVIKPVPNSIPLECPTCDSALENHHCTNPVCPSKGLTPIVKMLQQVSDSTLTELETIAKAYCADFPYNASESSPVSDLLDYLTLLDPSRDLSTAARVQVLESKFPDFHAVLFELEQRVCHWFSITVEKQNPFPRPVLTMEPALFWDVLTLTGLKDSDAAILNGISPVGTYDLLGICLQSGMSRPGMRVVASIAPLVTRILDRARLNVI